MTVSNKNKQNSGLSPIIAAVTGAIVGAGAAIAGATILKNKNNRKKINDVIAKVKDQATDYIKDIQNKAQGEKGEIEEKIAGGKVKVKKLVKIAKKAIKETKKI